MGRSVEARTGRHERTRQHLVVDILLDRVALAGEQRLVEFEARRRQHVAVDDDLVARAELEHVVGHDLADTDLRRLTVTADPSLRRRQHREFVEGAAGLQLLHDADHRVGDDHAGEQRVGRVAGDEDQHEQGADDAVDRREDVGLDDLQVRPNRGVGDVVDPAVGDPFGDLGGREPGERVGHVDTPSSS